MSVTIVKSNPARFVASVALTAISDKLSDLTYMHAVAAFGGNEAVAREMYKEIVVLFWASVVLIAMWS